MSKLIRASSALLRWLFLGLAMPAVFGTAAQMGRAGQVDAPDEHRIPVSGTLTPSDSDAIQEGGGALANMRHPHPDGHYKMAAYELLVAQAALGNNDPRTALHHANKALLLLQERIAALKVSAIPRAWPQPHLLPAAFFFKIKAERVLGLEDAERWRADMDMAVLAMQRSRTAGYTTDPPGTIDHQRALFDLAIDLASEAYEHTHSAADLDRFLSLTEARRSNLLQGSLNELTNISFKGVPDTVLTREKQLITALYPADARATTGDHAGSENALAGFLERLSKESPQYFALRYGEPRITLEDLRKRLLSPQRDLLVYAFTDTHLSMMVVRTDTAALVRVPSRGISEAAQALNAAIRSKEKDAYASAASALYAKVFAPVAGLLVNDELLIITDGDLQAVNFETLLFEPAGKGRLSEHMLIRKYAIGYLISATTALQSTMRMERPTIDVLAFAPGFSDELKQGYLAQVRDTATIDRQFLSYGRQPYAVSTAEGLGDLLSAHVVIGADASEARFRELAKDFGVLHLGTYAGMNSTSPMYSHLVLSKDGSASLPDADGYLHVHEIYELDLRAHLAVLPGWGAGTGTADMEGVRSLGYSFAYAGCPALVISIGSIDEKVGSEVITSFYEYLAAQMPKHMALQQAKLEHLDNAPDELQLPYYWAGLRLLGDVKAVDVGGTPNAAWVAIIGSSLALVALVVWFLRLKD